MRSLMIKTSAASGAAMLGHPFAPLGPAPGGGTNYRVTEIPDDVGDREVVRLFDKTANLTWLFDEDAPTGEGGRHEFRFAELGEGVIIKE